MADELDKVWKALSDPTRRTILDLLRGGPRSTTDIVDEFPDMTRFAVMKHMDVLRDADLVITRSEGRRRVNSLNAVPIRRIYERWMGPFAELWSSMLLRLRDDFESDDKKKRITAK
jgi:Predicted transcriptional regulators